MKTILIGLLLITSISFAQEKREKDDCCLAKITQFDEASTETLGKEYLRLKKNNSKCCDRWGSDLMSIMTVLQERLSVEGITKSYLVEIMGEPDEIRTKTENHGNHSPQSEEYIYYWRGKHDYLYFQLDGQGKIKGSDWYYAYE